jgi:hypothetical protein
LRTRVDGTTLKKAYVGLDMSKQVIDKEFDKKYVKFFRKIGDYSVYLVDDFAIRNTSLPHEEFTNFAIHDDFPRFIPKDQIWISKKETEREREFYILNCLKRYELLKSGSSSGRAYDQSLKYEKEMRAKYDGLPPPRSSNPSEHPVKHESSQHPHPPKEIYKKYLRDFRGYTVYMVNQELVQDLYKIDFVDGGNPSVYHWIPEGEIWIADALAKSEMKFVLWHEYVECRLMKEKGLDYDHAHELASKQEYGLRHKTETPTAQLKKLGLTTKAYRLNS